STTPRPWRIRSCAIWRDGSSWCRWPRNGTRRPASGRPRSSSRPRGSAMRCPPAHTRAHRPTPSHRTRRARSPGATRRRCSTRSELSGPRATPGTSSFPTRPTIERIDRIHWEGRHLLMNLLNIEVPVISAINGPAWRHSEIPLLCDIVLAAETAQFQDSAHFASDVVPGDGMHIVYPLLLGMNRGRYFLLTGQTLDAAAALRLGLVAEVLPADKLLARAWALAEDLVHKPTLLLRYTRLLFTEYLRRQMHDLLGYGLAMESLALFEKPETPAAPDKR